MASSDVYELAVVGAGIAGLYCCMRTDCEKQIALYEATDRIGGRIETVPMDEFNSEYGSMRFDPVRQVMIGRLIQELGLETEPFPEYSCPSIQKRRMIYELDKSERHLTTLELMSLALQRALNMSEDELFHVTEDELDNIRRHGRHKGDFLWKQGLWNVFSDVLSYDALKYMIMEGSFFHFIHENPNASGWMLTWVQMMQMSKYLRGMKNGIKRLTDAMLKRVLEKGVSVHNNHMLQALAPSGHGEIKLFFNTGHTVLAKEVILAIPPRSLSTLKGLPANISGLLDSVMDIPLLKCFFVIQHPWWDKDIPNEEVTSLPARELHYWSREGKGNVMIYADRPYINFWSQYVSAGHHDKAELCGNPALPSVFANHMGIDVKNITSFGIRDWGRPPYGAACHLWRPGIQPWKIIEELSAFPLTKGAAPNVHICGEAFSDYQGFMEGALRTAHSVISKIQHSI